MKAFLYPAAIFLFLISCAKKDNGIAQPVLNNGDTTMKSKDTSQITFLALGDSYTVGSSVSYSESFPVQTFALLKAQHVDIDTPEIIATNGWTTVNLMNSLAQNPPQHAPYTLVTLLIGVNNQYQGGSLEDYKAGFSQLLIQAISYAGNHKDHVTVLSIPDYSVTPFASGRDTAEIAKEIDAFNSANKQISLAAGVNYLDITGISREAKSDPSLIAADGLHPSGAQYGQWSKLLAALMLQELR